MKTMRIRNLLTLAVCCFAAVLLSGAAFAADTVASGTCGAEGDGSNLTWTLDSEGTLTISGQGAMKDWSETRYLPWYSPRVRIKTVNIGSGVTSIGSTAFDGCTSLTNVTIPDGVTKIGNASFVGCRNLTSILIPDTVTIIGDYAFRNCGFKTVTIPNRVTSIGRCAFDHSSLRSITIPESVTYIGEMAFVDCRSLEDVYITDMDAWCRITFDGPFATPMGCAKNIYLNGSKIESVNVPSGVSSLSYTFYNFRDLIEVTLPDSVTNIGAATFENCSSLTDINIPSGVTNIGASAFSSCSSLSRVSITDIAAWCGISFGDGYSTFVGVYANPLYQEADLYLDGEKLTSLEIPEGVSSISPYAFCGAVSIERVTLPHSLSSIGENAFYCCNNLKSVSYTGNEDEWNAITIDSGNTCLTNAEIRFAPTIVASGTCGAEGDGSNLTWTLDSEGTLTISGQGKMKDYNSFNIPWDSNSSSIKTVNISDGVTSIGSCAFQHCSALTSVTIPEGVTSIGDVAFSGCTNLTSVTIPKGVTSIGYYAFFKCTGLTSINIPEGVTSIGSDAFQNCSGLTSVTISEGVTSIGDSAFEGCINLIRIAIPDGVTSIGGSAFRNCTSLTSVNIPSSVTSIGKLAFYNCTSLTLVYITDIGAWCRINFDSQDANPLHYANNLLYLNGTKVETLEIPEGTQVISQYAFINASCIKRVAIPKSLVSVGGSAFSGCKNIEKVYYAGSESEWKNLAISTGNEPLTGAQIFYNSTPDNYYCRITAKVCDGGRVSVSANTAVEGETITVTATPYAGYQLDGIYVDGTLIEGNTFTVTGNHEVSARFSLLPVYGGTDEYRLEGITVMTAAGEPVQELTSEKLLVSVSVRHMEESSGAVVMLAQYDAEGRYQGLLWLTLDEMPLGMALKVTLPVDNSDGKIANLKVFVVSSILAPVPMGNAVSFGSV